MRSATPLRLLLARGALALLLLLAQQQAALHWLGHAVEAAQAKYGGPLPSSHCDDCVSFGALGAAAPSLHALALPPAPRDAPVLRTPVTAAPAALRLAFRSRAPPVLV